MANEPTKLMLNVPALSFADERVLYDHLTTTAPSQPIDDLTPAYLYRGQTGRFTERSWPAYDMGVLSRGHYSKFESLVPTDTRKLEAALLAGPAVLDTARRQALEDEYGQMIADIRVGITLNAAKDTAKLLGLARESQWLTDSMSNKYFLDKLLSIGQHYGLATQYMDASSDWQVALSFATHGFESAVHIDEATRPGVVYRIDREKLVAVLQRVAGELGYDSRRFRLIDIRDTPPKLAARASIQHGWSIVGLEQPEVLAGLISDGGITALTFPHTPTTVPGLEAIARRSGDTTERMWIEMHAYEKASHWVTNEKKLMNFIRWPKPPIDVRDQVWADRAFGKV